MGNSDNNSENGTSIYFQNIHALSWRIALIRVEGSLRFERARAKQWTVVCLKHLFHHALVTESLSRRILDILLSIFMK